MRHKFDLKAFNAAIDNYVARSKNTGCRAELLVQLCALRKLHEHDELPILKESASLAQCLQDKANFLGMLNVWHKQLDDDYKRTNLPTSESVYELQSLEGFIRCVKDMPQVTLEKSSQVAEPAIQLKPSGNGLKYFLGALSAIAAFILLTYAALLIASVFSPALALFALSQATIAVAAVLVLAAVGCALAAAVAFRAAASGVTLMKAASQLFVCGPASETRIQLGRRFISEATVVKGASFLRPLQQGADQSESLLPEDTTAAAGLAYRTFT